MNQSTTGTGKGNAIINLHLATGRIGKPGAGPFSITGQPNAMGGCEVGGLASMLAAHMGFDGFEYAGPADIFREFAAQTAFENDGTRVLDLSAIAAIDDAAYAALAPFQWGGASPFAGRRFTTSDGRARLVPVVHTPRDDATRALPLSRHRPLPRPVAHDVTAHACAGEVLALDWAALASRGGF